MEEILSHLGALRYRKAQLVAQEAAARFPGHAGIRRMDRALNRWKAATRPADGHSRTEELAWLRSPPESARGKLVALVGSELVAAADTMAELTECLRSKPLSRSPLVVRIG